MKKEQTDLLRAGECTFGITGSNDMMLRALMKYTMMLDTVASQVGDEEQLTMDGLINFLLDDAINRNIKEIIKRHGFEDRNDFYDSIATCQSGEEVKAVCEDREKTKLMTMREQIREQMPIDDKQMNLPL